MRFPSEWPDPFLGDRFKMKSHWETPEIDGPELLVAYFLYALDPAQIGISFRNYPRDETTHSDRASIAAARALSQSYALHCPNDGGRQIP